jgi:hypothetical protein
MINPIYGLSPVLIHKGTNVNPFELLYDSLGVQLFDNSHTELKAKKT